MIRALPILWSYLVTRHFRKFRSRAGLEAWQDCQVRRFLGRVLPRSPFYASLYAGLDGVAWRSFPIIGKKEWVERFDELNTAGVRAQEAWDVALRAERTRDFAPRVGGLTVGLSTGTTGNRGLFLCSDSEIARYMGSILARVLPGGLLARHRIAFFMRANSNLYTAARGRRIRFEFFDLLEPFESHLERLRAFDPTLLIGPPLALVLLARSGVAIRPRKVVSVAEVLDPLDEARISQAFGQKVHQVYQCTEGFLGVTCEHGTLHLNEDLVVVQKEYLAPGRFVPIVTDFRRETQPIVRYRLDDILVERPTPCPCGSPFTALEAIEGRCDDLLYWPASDGSEPKPVFPDFVRRAIVAASPAIEEYRAVQTGPDTLMIALRAADPAALEAAVARELAALAASLGCLAPRVEFSHRFDPVGARKLRRIQRAFKLR